MWGRHAKPCSGWTLNDVTGEETNNRDSPEAENISFACVVVV
jgi:hypothetical protein